MVPPNDKRHWHWSRAMRSQGSMLEHCARHVQDNSVDLYA
eukprot:CAMPEP_0198597470 /NCGR_PEP_ID=MMETSP1462-20131121/144457_1 /TAXON_ID=1333877 /ORGANISM="Brandtodinium nutriculum, Strain RCC3387" /LENGTH=39 /DNA_ID= /DNA_START= /DNA_END= /DNA_ORIENTATION=